MRWSPSLAISLLISCTCNFRGCHFSSEWLKWLLDVDCASRAIRSAAHPDVVDHPFPQCTLLSHQSCSAKSIPLWYLRSSVLLKASYLAAFAGRHLSLATVVGAWVFLPTLVTSRDFRRDFRVVTTVFSSDASCPPISSPGEVYVQDSSISRHWEHNGRCKSHFLCHFLHWE